MRITTNSVLKNYRSNLMKSYNTLNSAVNTVLTGRNFNTYAEDPAAASRSFQLRRSYQRIAGQLSVSQSVKGKFDSAWQALNSVSLQLDSGETNSALESAIRGTSGTAGAGRNALGAQLKSLAENIVQTMNNQYGDQYIFAGADEMNAPFALDADGNLTFRGINVDCAEGSEDYQKLTAMLEETKYVDLGLGLQESGGELIETTAFDSALNGLEFLGYGVDEDGAPRNIVSMIYQMGDKLSKCSPDGKWEDPADGEYMEEMLTKFTGARNTFKEAWVAMDSRTGFLTSNQEQLEDQATSLNTQILDLEQCNPAQAISAMSWAQYCYNTALKMGNSILSQSLMDYIS